MSLLEVQDIRVAYGGSEVVHGISLHVEKDEIVCILGRNGVGKTTSIKAIMGLQPAKTGKIVFDGHDITNMKPYNIARLGMGYVPQGRMIFPKLTVEENLQSGTLVRGHGVQAIPSELFEWFPVLHDRLSQKGGTLSGGEQQQLAIARCIAGNPSFVLLDEPSEGIQPNIVQRIREIIKQINREKGITFLLVEQNLKFCLDCGMRGYIMETGMIQGEGDMQTIATSPVIQQYLTFKA
ncbi:MAG: urea ABC transporter ATP-binding subunit UrtE [Eubacteriales bacterium]|nr:urea ABC transporter ATP-binding subunit UrtE [Eubacteriales bacterium]